MTSSGIDVKVQPGQLSRTSASLDSSLMSYTHQGARFQRAHMWLKELRTMVLVMPGLRH